MSVKSKKTLQSYKITRDSKDGKSGLAVIFAFENFSTGEGKREGTEHEISNLESLFTKMNLRVHVLRDLKLGEMKLALTVITKPDKYKKQNVEERFWHARLTKQDSVIFMAVTSHGDYDRFQVFDGKMRDRDLEEYFYSDACSILEGCPKLFLYNKCRDICGVKRFEIANVPDAYTAHCTSEIIVTDGFNAHCDKDIVVIYTCAVGVQSLRSESRGSLVLSEFPRAYEEYGKGQDILDFIKALNHELLSIIAKTMRSTGKFPHNVTQIVSVEKDTTCKQICFLSPSEEIDPLLTTQLYPSSFTTSVPVPPIASVINISTTYDPSNSCGSASPASSYEYSHSHSPSNFTFDSQTDIFDGPSDFTIDSPTDTLDGPSDFTIDSPTYTLDGPSDFTIDSPTDTLDGPSDFTIDSPTDTLDGPSDFTIDSPTDTLDGPSDFTIDSPTYTLDGPSDFTIDSPTDTLDGPSDFTIDSPTDTLDGPSDFTIDSPTDTLDGPSDFTIDSPTDTLDGPSDFTIDSPTDTLDDPSDFTYDSQ